MKKICAYNLCGIDFEPKTANMRYCCDEHTKLATNARIMEKYYKTKARRAGKVRICLTCDTQLSRYNDGDLCALCERNAGTLDDEFLKRMFGL